MSICAFSESIESAAFVRGRTKLRPTVAVVLGSGLGAFAESMEDRKCMRFSEIPHFPVSTVHGHGGQLVVGTINGTPVAVMQGRVHAYEGYKPSQVVFPLRMLRQFGIGQVILTNAAGSVRQDLHRGELVLISDHINMSGQNPLAGPNDERFGPRFFDMTNAYSPRLRALAQEVAQSQGFSMPEGVYLSVLGPSFETPAEIRAFRSMGADMIGMSTVQETIAARHMGMEVLGISCVTNFASGLQKEPLSHEEVLENGKQADDRLLKLISTLIPRMVQGNAA